MAALVGLHKILDTYLEPDKTFLDLREMVKMVKSRSIDLFGDGAAFAQGRRAFGADFDLPMRADPRPIEPMGWYGCARAGVATSVTNTRAALTAFMTHLLCLHHRHDSVGSNGGPSRHAVSDAMEIGPDTRRTH